MSRPSDGGRSERAASPSSPTQQAWVGLRLLIGTRCLEGQGEEQTHARGSNGRPGPGRWPKAGEDSACASPACCGWGCPGWLLVAAYLGTRSRAYNVTEEDTVVVADFANSTGDSVFDGALRQGLSVQLQQSPFLRIVSDQRIRETLRSMKEPQDARLVPEIAKDLCVRVGSKVYIEGSITNFGNNYVIGLQAVDCSTGDLLAQQQVQETGKERVLDGLSRAAGRLRETLGESISSVRKFDTPLAQATTPSLEALRALSMGRDALADGNYAGAVSWFQRAIAIDPISPSPTELLGPLIPTWEKAISRKRTTGKPLSFEVKSASGKDWALRPVITGVLQATLKKHEMPIS